MRAGRWMFMFALLLALGVGLAVLNRPVAAASSGCSAVGSALTSAPGLPYDNSASRTFTGDFSTGETISASATGFDNPGISYPVTLTVNGNVQNPYTIPADGSYTVVASVDSLPEATNVTVGCSAPQSPASASQWQGYTDGRLGADPAEAYSLWCSGNNLNVWSAASGRGVQLAAISLVSLIGQPVGMNLPYPATGGGTLFVVRNGTDSFAVQGNTGNYAPAFGVKPFSLAQCITANGGAPVVPATMTSQLRTVLPTRTPTRPPTRTPSRTPVPTATPTLVTTPFVLGVAGLLTSSNDTDGDGVPDSSDYCKYVPGTIYGCNDPDSDGLAGPWDLCPYVAGLTSLRGCPDSDGDGVANTVDLCPDEAPPADQNAQGCLDTDRDGVADTQDWCPTQIRQAGVVQFQGCNDPDYDGFVIGFRVPVAYQDNCPAVNGFNGNNGCPLPTAVPTYNATAAAQATLFAFANQVGAFQGLVYTNPTATPSCTRANFGFCLGG